MVDHTLPFNNNIVHLYLNLNFFTVDMYPWQACLDENTKCYYYWNVETNEVQWHPPEQLSAAPDTQTTDDSHVADRPNYEGGKEEQGYEEDDDYDATKGDYS